LLYAIAPGGSISAFARLDAQYSGPLYLKKWRNLHLFLFFLNGERYEAMNKQVAMVVAALLAHTPAYAINAKYRQQLERSGCTQVTEAQGCDITKTKKENAKAGFGTGVPANEGSASNHSPYTGQWVAKATSGATVATIRIDNKEHVWVNGKKVNAKRSDGALVFRDGSITYTIQGDRRLKGEDFWADSDAGTKGPIKVE
jgi:hypothetical protein